MKRRILAMTLLTAVAAVGLAFRASAAEPEFVRAYYVQGPQDTSLKYDAAKVSPLTCQLNKSGDSATFTATPPAGYNISEWLWKDAVTMSTSGMTAIAGAVPTCTIGYSGQGEHTLCARFDYVPLSVVFDKNGGSGQMASLSGKNIGSTFTLPSCSFTRTGHSFSGWTNELGSSFNDQAVVSGSDFWDEPSWSFKSTLYAKWTANGYTVAFDAQGGSGGTASVTATYGSDMPAATMPTRTGYTFGGYWTGTDGTGTQYYNADGASARTWDGTSATTLYAKWTANTYTVTFKNKGSGGDDSVTATYGLDMPAATMPTRTGYTFGGYWTSTLNPNGVKYYNADGTSAHVWDKTADGSLYAKWAANSYTVAFDAQGGSGGTNSVLATYGSDMPAAAMPTRTGYTFGGYWTGTDGTGTQYYNADGTSARTWNKTSTTTLYAKWTANTYTVAFGKNSGSGGDDSVLATYGSDMPAAAMPTRTGYTFGGYWTSTLNPNGVKYYNADGTSAHVWDRASDTTTLYAKWTANSYTVTFDRNGGSGGTSSITATYGSAMPAATMPARTGYTFDGYYAGTGGTGTKYYNADGSSARTWNRASSTTLYAKWAANSYMVAFDAQGGSGGTNSVMATYGSAMPAAAMPTRTGYMFGGYWTGMGGTGTQYYYADGTSARTWDGTSDTTTLYAKWTANSYTVTFSKAGGSGGTDSVMATYGSAMPAATPPTRTGYTFDGYWTSTLNPKGVKYYNADGTSAHDWDKAYDGSLYAKWTANSYTVTFDRAGGSGGTNSVMATYGSAMPAAAMPTRTGYTFGGYWTGTGGTGTQYYAADGSSAKNWNVAGATTLYAKWDAISYAIEFSGGEGASGTMATQSFMVDEAKTLSPNNFKRTGYTFGGWATNAAAATALTATYADCEVVSNLTDKAETKTLYAVWSTNAYYVAFDPVDGEGEPMAAQKFFYDQPQGLSSNSYSRGEQWDFGGWSNVVDGAVYADGALVSNLCSEANATNTLVAVWQFVSSIYSKALDCDSAVLYFEASAGWQLTDSDWQYGGSSMKKQGNGGNLAATVTNEFASARRGTLSFWWAGDYKGSGPYAEYAKLSLLADGVPVEEYTSTKAMFADGHVQEWANVEQVVEVPAGGSVEIAFVNASAEQADRTVWVDHVSWTWDGGGDEPGPGDAREISGMSFSDGTLSLVFTNADSRFSYDLHGTNELVSPLSLWPVLWTTNGTGTITIEPPVVPGETKMFYYLETRKKE